MHVNLQLQCSQVGLYWDWDPPNLCSKSKIYPQPSDPVLLVSKAQTCIGRLSLELDKTEDRACVFVIWWILQENPQIQLN